MTVACSKVHDNDNWQQIVFCSGIETKAFLDSDDINVAGTELTIYGFNGTNFIPGEPASYSVAGGWTLEDKYYWESGKDYSFFAWLSKDKDGHSAPSGLVFSDRTLTVPVSTFDFLSKDNDFDFCYSDVVCRSAEEADHSAVNLNMKHLYTAIAFSAHNYTDKTITVKEVSLVGLKNSKSASINFADTGTEVTYETASCTWTGASRKLNSGDIILAASVECAIIVGTPSDTPDYFMFWPQTSGELTAEGWADSSYQPSDGAYIKVVYDKGGTEYIRYAKFPQDKDGTNDLGWPAGTKRLMQLAFREDSFTIEAAALPWDYTVSDVNYDDEVTVISPLQFDSATCTVDEENRKVYFKGANPISGSFKLSSPSTAAWFISKEGDYDAFEIDDTVSGRYGDGTDCNYGSVDVVEGNRFTIYPKDVAAGRDYSIQLTFSIRYPDGESYCVDGKIQVDDALQPVRWTIILTK